MKPKHARFTTIREDFNEYECENGQILKAKQILADILHTEDEAGKPMSNFGFKDVSTVITPTPIDTSDLEFIPREQVTEKHVVKELKFKVIREVINIYESKNSIILISPRVSNIRLTNKKDETGSPLIRYTTNTGMSVIPKKSLNAEDIPSQQGEKTSNQSK